MEILFTRLLLLLLTKGPEQISPDSPPLGKLLKCFIQSIVQLCLPNDQIPFINLTREFISCLCPIIKLFNNIINYDCGLPWGEHKYAITLNIGFDRYYCAINICCHCRFWIWVSSVAFIYQNEVYKLCLRQAFNSGPLQQCSSTAALVPVPGEAVCNFRGSDLCLR